MTEFGCLDDCVRRGYVLGQLGAVVSLLKEAQTQNRFGNDGTAEDYLRSSLTVLTNVESQVSHQDLTSELEPLVLEIGDTVRAMDDGTFDITELAQKISLWIKITIRIGKVTITIEW